MESVPQEINQQQNIAGLAKKLATVMGQLKRIPKNATNEHFKYKYTSESDLLDTIRPLLAEQSVFIIPSILDAEKLKIEYEEYGKPKVKFETRMDILFTIIDGETGATMNVPWTGEAHDTQDKGIGKCMTLSTKYFLKSLFLVSTGDPMDDPDSGMDGEKKDEKPTQERKPATSSTSTKKATTTKKVEAPPTPKASPLDDLRKKIHAELAPLTDAEIAKFAGINNFNDLNEWRKTYTAIGDAFVIIQNEFRKPANAKADGKAETLPFGSTQTGKSRT